MNFELTTYLYTVTPQASFWEDFFRDIASGLIGGIISGLISGGLLYLWVIWREKKNNKSACTTALLQTQTTLMFQMQELAGLKTICETILNIKIGGDTLSDIFKNTSSVSEILQLLTHILPGMTFDEKGLFHAANYIITEPYRNHILKLPYEIFEIKKICTAECAVYFQDISRCNRKYNEIIALIERYNNIRDKILLQENASFKDNEFRLTTNLDNVFSVIAKSIDLAKDLIKRTEEVQEKMTTIFDKTAAYIKLLQVSEPIEAQKDENGKIIFNEVNNAP